MDEKSFIVLETKISYQEVAIEELQNTVHEQYLRIQKLEKSIKILTERFKAASQDDNPIGPAGEKPPHY